MTDAIDRIAPTQRPEGRVAQRQSWLDLTFLHWRIPVSVLRPLLPAALEIDTYEGDAFIGVVPFTMTGVRPLWAPPVPGISNFHETNVVHVRAPWRERSGRLVLQPRGGEPRRGDDRADVLAPAVSPRADDARQGT